MPPKAERAAAANAANDPQESERLPGAIPNPSSPKRGSAQVLIASITKSHCSELRVFVSEWRGVHKIELRDYGAMVPGCWSSAGAGVTLDITLLPELLRAVLACEREAIARDLLKREATE